MRNRAYRSHPRARKLGERATQTHHSTTQTQHQEEREEEHHHSGQTIERPAARALAGTSRGKITVPFWGAEGKRH
eukprot:9492521-Pyramimonas_sp.AAC.1